MTHTNTAPLRVRRGLLREESVMRLLRRLWSWIWGPPAPVQDAGRTVEEEWANIWMRRMFPQQWAHTQGTIEQRLQAMLIARNEDGQPCWSQEDWTEIYKCLKGVQDSRRVEQWLRTSSAA